MGCPTSITGYGISKELHVARIHRAPNEPFASDEERRLPKDPHQWQTMMMDGIGGIKMGIASTT